MPQSDSSARRMTKSDVTALDLQAYQKNQNNKEQIEILKASLSEHGFLVLKNNTLDSDLIKKCYELNDQFFNLDKSEKEKCLHSSIQQNKFGNIGYYPYLKEQAVTAKTPDLKEFFHVGPMDETVKNRSSYYAYNAWPQVPEEYQYYFEKLYSQLLSTAKIALQMLAEAYNLNFDYINDLTQYSNSILRSIHYPPVDNEYALKGAIRAAEHTGINLIGLQPFATDSGLQFYTPHGEWVYLDQNDFSSCLSMNVGEMLQYLTNGTVQPTLHRVVNEQDAPKDKSRHAIVFFVHSDSSLDLVPKQINDTYPVINSGSWLKQRLESIKIV